MIDSIYQSSNNSNKFTIGALKKEVQQLFRQYLTVSNKIN